MQVDPKGLELWSRDCGAAAAKLASSVTGATGLPDGQATAAAVTASDTLAAAAAQVFSVRVLATGAEASSAANGYVEFDVDSAQALAEVAQGSVL
jgi:hypothetical protein